MYNSYNRYNLNPYMFVIVIVFNYTMHMCGLYTSFMIKRMSYNYRPFNNTFKALGIHGSSYIAILLPLKAYEKKFEL